MSDDGVTFLQWYRADWDYGQTTVAFFCAAIAAAIALYSVVFLRDKVRQRRTADASVKLENGARASPGVLDRLTAACRYASSRQFSIERLGYYSPPLSAILLVCGMAIFILSALIYFLLTSRYTDERLTLRPDSRRPPVLLAKPHDGPQHAHRDTQRMDRHGHSAFHDVRTFSLHVAAGMLIDLRSAFATKVNFVAILTGSSHERLQVLHRWSALLMCTFSAHSSMNAG